MRLGIVIPYRDRADHLKQSLPILQRHGKVFIVEQLGNDPFNRAKLLNIGYQEFKNEFDYFAAHDVDMIPEKANYSWTENPCHLASMVSQFGYGMPYPDYFGGVTLLPKDKFELVNGYSNEYWGWGGEDDELRRRFLEKSVAIFRRQCKFISIHHPHSFDKALRMKNVARLKSPVDWTDGLSSCNYKIFTRIEFPTHTLLRVNL